MEDKSGRLWIEMAKQIYAENGRDSFREIGHYPNGAPFLFGIPSRISVTHASHLLAIASLPKTPEADLSHFNTRTALGIDAERFDRTQVLKIREKFLSPRELEMVPADDVEANVIAWTAKEALYKAALSEGLDFRSDLQIESLPSVDRQMNMPGAPAPVLGKARIAVLRHKDNEDTAAPAPSKSFYDMLLYTYDSEGYCVTIAFSPKCAKFSRR